MSSIDQRVVQMLFDNTAFEKGITTTLSSLDKLNKGLQLSGATKGLDDVDSAASKFSLGNIASDVDSVTSKFSALSVIGISALATIASKAVTAGIAVVKSFTIDPIKEGFQNYETQINAVQTILANTGLKGAAGLAQVNSVLADLNKYANLTVYNFSEMAENIGTFTAAGVGLKESVESIKGIANLAALSGSSADQASTAMYQLSQAIASGKVQLQDWNSVVNAGLGGKILQTALINTARVSGVAIDSIIKKAGSFRNSLQSGWLTSQILTKTLAQFTGDLSVAQIKAMGYTSEQAQQIFVLSQTAVNAATKIKTMTQLTDALKEEVGTAYAAIFKTIFGNITQATVLFSGIHNAAENALTIPIYELNALLQSWEALGGRTDLIDAITNVFKDLGAVMAPIKGAFEEIFPPTSAVTLFNITQDFLNLTKEFKIGASDALLVKESFAGVFAVFSIAIFIIKQVAGQLLSLLGYTADSSRSFLQVTANVGNFLVRLKTLIETSQRVTEVFGAIGEALALPVNLIQILIGFAEELFEKFEGDATGKASGALNAISNQLGPIGKLANLADEAWVALYNHLQGIANFFAPLAAELSTFFAQLGQSIINGLETMNFSGVLAVVNTGLLGGLLLLVKKFVAKFQGGGGSLGGFVDTIKETFEGLTGSLEAMQNTLKAATLLEIAVAIGVLTISMIALSKINQQGLIQASSAITVMFLQLIGSMTLFSHFIGAEDSAKMVIMMAALILFASAIDILASAAVKLAGLDWAGIGKGLTGLGGIMAEFLVTVKLMGSPEGLIASGLGLTAFAKGVNVLAKAVVTLSGLSWEELAKGLTAVGALLGSLGLFTKFAEADATGVLQGAGIILLATGINILAIAMGRFGAFSWETIGKGLTSMAGGLALIAGALFVLPPSSLLSAAAILVVASSLGLISTAVQKMGSFSWESIGKGMTVLAGGLGFIADALFLLPPSSLLSAAAIYIVAASLGLIANALVKMGGQSWDAIAKGLVELSVSLTLIAAAVILMEEALPGAAAILVTAVALAILTPVMIAFGNMSWMNILKSLAELAGVFVVIGAAGLLLAPLVPILLGLGASILLLGAGILLAGAGVLLFSIALTALAVAGAAGAAALVAIVTSMIGLLPEVAKGVGQAVIAFSTTIATAGPQFTAAMVTVLTAMLNAINTLAPKINATMIKLLNMLLQDALNLQPKFESAAIQMLVNFLNGIAQKMPAVANAGTNVIVAFLNAVGAELPRVEQAGVNLILKFINGLANTIRANVGPMEQAGENLGSAIIDGMTGGLSSKAGEVLGEAENIAGKVLTILGHALGVKSPSTKAFAIGAFVSEGLGDGITSLSSYIEDSSGAVGKAALLSMGKSIAGMSSLINQNIDANPTITPVLDLTDLKKNAGKIGGLLNTQPVSVTTTAGKASIVSAGYTANQLEAVTPSTPKTPPKPPVNYTQNNYSPKALSSADIYRQTKNSISKLRGVVVYQGGSPD